MLKPPPKDFPPSFFTIGSEIIAGFLLSMGAAWLLGKLLNFPASLRIILGAVLSAMVNCLMIYKIVKKK